MMGLERWHEFVPAATRTTMQWLVRRLLVGVLVRRLFVSVLLLVTGAGCSVEETTSEPPGVDASKYGWPDGTRLVQLENALAETPDLAMFRPAKGEGRPAVIVIHGWFGDVFDPDGTTLVAEAMERDVHYLYPNVRGPHVQTVNCCSDVAMADLDGAIRFLAEYTGTNPDDVYFVSASGGAYTALCYYMKRKRRLGGMRAWVPVTDLLAFHDAAPESAYAESIRGCTGSEAFSLNREEATKRSPRFMPEASQLKLTPLQIIAGINDGHDGPVPLSNSLDMFNRLSHDAGDAGLGSQAYHALLARDASLLPVYGDSLGNRSVVFSSKASFGSLVVFDGGHEMLADVALRGIGD